MRIPRESKKPRNRHLPPPGKSERFWARKAGEEDATKPVTGGSLAALDARLAAIEAELAAKWPNALVTRRAA